MIPAFESRRKLALAGIAVAGLAGLVAWQLWPRHVLEGRKVDYYKVYDRMWEIGCDTDMSGGDTRCYLQYVDVYRPRPDFAAAMVEIVYHSDGDGPPDPHVRFDIEPGLSFAKAEVVVESDDGMQEIDLSACPKNTCRVSGDAARAMLATWRTGHALHLRIDEGRDAPAHLTWTLRSMPTILEDFAEQRRARNLP